MDKKHYGKHYKIDIKSKTNSKQDKLKNTISIVLENVKSVRTHRRNCDVVGDI